MLQTYQHQQHHHHHHVCRQPTPAFRQAAPKGRPKLKRGLSYFLVYLLLLPMVACADVVSTLSDFLSYLTGPVGKAVAMLAIVGVGFGCFALGKVPKSYVIAVVVGVGIIFGAQTLLMMLTS